MSGRPGRRRPWRCYAGGQTEGRRPRADSAILFAVRDPDTGASRPCSSSKSPTSSDLLAATVGELQLPVLRTQIAERRLAGPAAALLRDDAAFSAAACLPGARVYSNSENAIGWIAEHLCGLRPATADRAVQGQARLSRSRRRPVPGLPLRRGAGERAARLRPGAPARARSWSSRRWASSASGCTWSSRRRRGRRWSTRSSLKSGRWATCTRSRCWTWTTSWSRRSSRARSSPSTPTTMPTAHLCSSTSTRTCSPRPTTSATASTSRTPRRSRAWARRPWSSSRRSAGAPDSPTSRSTPSCASTAPATSRRSRSTRCASAAGARPTSRTSPTASTLIAATCAVSTQTGSASPRRPPDAPRRSSSPTCPTSVDLVAIASVDYEGFAARFSRVLELRPTDFNRYPVFAFTFVQVPSGRSLRAARGAGRRPARAPADGQASRLIRLRRAVDALAHRRRRQAVFEVQRRVEALEDRALESAERVAVVVRVHGHGEMRAHPLAERLLGRRRDQHRPLHLQLELAEEDRGERPAEGGHPDLAAEVHPADACGRACRRRPCRRATSWLRPARRRCAPPREADPGRARGRRRRPRRPRRRRAPAGPDPKRRPATRSPAPTWARRRDRRGPSRRRALPTAAARAAGRRAVPARRPAALAWRSNPSPHLTRQGLSLRLPSCGRACRLLLDDGLSPRARVGQ